MNGNMMQMPLLISALIRHADRYHGDVEIVSRPAADRIHRYTYRDLIAGRVSSPTRSSALGVRPSSRVGTLAWNTHRHLELYFATLRHRRRHQHRQSAAVPGADRVHRQPCRGRDRVLRSAVSCRWSRRSRRAAAASGHGSRCPTARTCRPARCRYLCYEELVGGTSDDYAWPQFDENTAASLCYTSGTTGNPKGVLFAHRSTVAAHVRHQPGRQPRRFIARCGPSGHADVPRLLVGAAVRGVHGRRQAGAARRAARRGEPVSAVRTGGRHLHQRRADRLAWTAAISGSAESRAQHAQARRHRRVGLSAGDDRQVRGAGHRSDPCMGHDRDQPRVDDQPAQGQASDASRRRSAQAPHQAGPAGIWRRPEDRRQRGQGAAARRRRFWRPDGARPLGGRQATSRATAATCCATAGFRPATSRPWTPTASSRSPTGRRTSSSRAASGSARSTSRISPSPIPPWPKRR